MFCPCQLTVLNSSCSRPAGISKSAHARSRTLECRLTSALHSIDEHAPESHLTDDFVEWATANPVFLETVTQPIARSSYEHINVSEHAVLRGIVLVGEEVGGYELSPKKVSDRRLPAFGSYTARDLQDQDRRCK